jgi:hypothetical protein
MKRLITTLLWALLLPLAGMAQLAPQYYTPNQQFQIPPFNYAGWNNSINQNWVSLDNIFSGITPTRWKPKLAVGESLIVTDSNGNPLFTVNQNGTVIVNGALTCTGSPCGNGATGSTALPAFSLATGSYTAAQSLTLTSAGNTISWCTASTGSCNPNTNYTGAITVNASETLCANAHNSLSGFSATVCTSYVIGAGTGGTGGTGGGTGTDPGTNIGTVARTGILTNGSIPFKTCYVGSSVCSGGVGSQAPSSPPQRTAGLSTPNASTGTANAVASMSVSTPAPQPTFTAALWTTTGGGIGTDSTSTNWYRDFYVKTAMPAGHTHFEFDTYAFDDGWDWMWGTQCNNTSNLIQYDNQLPSWITIQVPCSALYDGNWHHIKQTFHRTLAADRSCNNGGSPCQTWDTITIDGTVYAIGKTEAATSSSWTGSGGQIQMDTEPVTASSGSPATATVYIDTDIVSAGSAPSGTQGAGGAGGGTTAGTGDLDSFNFDSGTLAGMGLTAVGSCSISTTNAHSAPNSMACPAGLNYVKDTLSMTGNIIYTRQYLFLPQLGTSVATFLRLYNTNAEIFNFYIQTNGNISAFDNATSTSLPAYGGTLTTGVTHLIETYTKISATAGQVIFKLDGTTTYTSATNLNTGTAAINTVWFGQIGDTTPTGWGTWYMDNVDFDNSGWIGPI